jgi:hypothetical protein
MGHEDPGAGEQALALQREDLGVVLDVSRNHAAPHVGDDGGQVQHCIDPPVTAGRR